MAEYQVDINCDMGESFGVYKLGLDEEVIKFISSANIACGFHAGDPSVMNKTVEIAVENNVAVGAHPGFPDLNGFGRRKIDMDPKEVKEILMYQIGALKAFATANNINLQHVKPHGALYNMASKNEELAQAIAEAIQAIDDNIIFVALAGSSLYMQAKKQGLRAASEVFADRAYNADGTLVSRKFEGAVIEDPVKVKKRVLRMVKEGEVETYNGEIIEVKADTICVHGDNPAAVELVQELNTYLEDNSVNIVSMEDFV